MFLLALFLGTSSVCANKQIIIIITCYENGSEIYSIFEISFFYFLFSLCFFVRTELIRVRLFAQATFGTINVGRFQSVL